MRSFASTIVKGARSSFPLVGLILTTIGFALLPATRRYLWFPLLADCGWFLFILPGCLDPRSYKIRHDVVAKYVGVRGNTTTTLSLYRNYALAADIINTGTVAFGRFGYWRPDAGSIRIRIGWRTRTCSTRAEDGAEVLMFPKTFIPGATDDVSLIRHPLLILPLTEGMTH